MDDEFGSTWIKAQRLEAEASRNRTIATLKTLFPQIKDLMLRARDGSIGPHDATLAGILAAHAVNTLWLELLDVWDLNDICGAGDPLDPHAS